MFTGIIEEIGTIKTFKKVQTGADIVIECQKVLKDTKIGDSIAINGVCQTVVELYDNGFKAQVSDETLRVTTFSSAKAGEKVNLERALMLNDRVGGHVVSGHVDSVAEFLEIKKNNEFYDLKFKTTDEAKRYIVKKGSITVNGISLTVADIEQNVFKCAIIPHTFENTNLSGLKIGDSVNIETDIMAKYIEKFLLAEKTTSAISENFLRENGFM